jgi:hypothetical protein
LLVHVPAEGLRAGTLGRLGFAIIWLGFAAAWTARVSWGIGGRQLDVFDWVKLSFSILLWLASFWLMGQVAWGIWGRKSVRVNRDGLRTYWHCLAWSRSRGPCPDAVAHRTVEFVLPAGAEEEERWLIAEINDFVRATGGAAGGRAYIVEVEGGPETRLADADAACERLRQLAAEDTIEIWVWIDHGARRRSWLDRLLGASGRESELCIWLGKVGDVAALMFHDGTQSGCVAADPGHPVGATEEQRRALAFGDLTPVPSEACLRADRAFQAAAEYLQSGERPGWLDYHYAP